MVTFENKVTQVIVLWIKLGRFSGVAVQQNPPKLCFLCVDMIKHSCLNIAALGPFLFCQSFSLLFIIWQSVQIFRLVKTRSWSQDFTARGLLASALYYYEMHLFKVLFYRIWFLLSFCSQIKQTTILFIFFLSSIRLNKWVIWEVTFFFWPFVESSRLL